MEVSEGSYSNHDSKLKCSSNQLHLDKPGNSHVSVPLQRDKLSRGGDGGKTSVLGSDFKPLEVSPLEAVCYGFPKNQRVVRGTCRQTGFAVPSAWVFSVHLERGYNFRDILFFGKPLLPVLAGCAESGFA